MTEFYIRARFASTESHMFNFLIFRHSPMECKRFPRWKCKKFSSAIITLYLFTFDIYEKIPRILICIINFYFIKLLYLSRLSKKFHGNLRTFPREVVLRSLTICTIKLINIKSFVLLQSDLGTTYMKNT